MLAEWLVKCEEERREEENTPDADASPGEMAQNTDVKVLPRCTLMNMYNESNFVKDAKLQQLGDENNSPSLHVNWLTKTELLPVEKLWTSPVVSHPSQTLVYCMFCDALLFTMVVKSDYSISKCICMCGVMHCTADT